MRRVSALPGRAAGTRPRAGALCRPSPRTRVVARGSLLPMSAQPRRLRRATAVVAAMLKIVLGKMRLFLHACRGAAVWWRAPLVARSQAVGISAAADPVTSVGLSPGPPRPGDSVHSPEPRDRQARSAAAWGIASWAAHQTQPPTSEMASLRWQGSRGGQAHGAGRNASQSPAPGPLAPGGCTRSLGAAAAAPKLLASRAVGGAGSGGGSHQCGKTHTA